MSKNCSKIIYFDNNSTTLICDKAAEIHNKWLKCYNPSSDSKISKPAKDLLDLAQNYILKHCGVNSLSHTVIFTSGATESNCLIIKSCVKSYKKKLLEIKSNLIPHIITSATEHPSILECLKDLEKLGEIEYTQVMPTLYGNILPEDVKTAIKPNTCLITIMFANNEIPIINNVSEIGKIAHERKIPIHSDCVQIFGKYKIDMKANNIDALSVSAHKFYGPKGVGLLIISNDLIEGYKLSAEIYGSQQKGLRGGTENVPGIASMMEALKFAFDKRKEKNKKLFLLREFFLTEFSNHYNFGDYENYLDDTIEKPPLEIISLGPPPKEKSFILPNTILISIVKNIGKPFCNVNLKKDLDSKGMIVSIGAACMTKSDKASHVLDAIESPPVVKKGVIRISFGDKNTIAEIKTFIKMLVLLINKQCSDIVDEIAEFNKKSKSDNSDKSNLSTKQDSNKTIKKSTKK